MKYVISFAVCGSIFLAASYLLISRFPTARAHAIGNAAYYLLGAVGALLLMLATLGHAAIYGPFSTFGLLLLIAVIILVVAGFFRRMRQRQKP